MSDQQAQPQAQTQPQIAARKIVKKLTIKTCGATPNLEKLIDYKKANGSGAVMPLLNVMGIASDFLPGTSDMGVYVKLIGQFKAINVETGELFVSGAAILPGSANDLIYGALKGVVESGGTVEFAFRIGVRYIENSKGGVPYEYDVEQVYQPQAADPLTQLENKLMGSNVAQISDATRATGTNGGGKKAK